MVQRVNMASPPAWLPEEERQHDRRTVNVAILVDDPGGSRPAMLVNLSNAGCRLQVSERLSLGAFITVQLSPTCEAKGWVAWSRGLEAGIDFSLCLPDDVVQKIAPPAD